MAEEQGDPADSVLGDPPTVPDQVWSRAVETALETSHDDNFELLPLDEPAPAIDPDESDAYADDGHQSHEGHLNPGRHDELVWTEELDHGHPDDPA